MLYILAQSMVTDDRAARTLSRGDEAVEGGRGRKFATFTHVGSRICSVNYGPSQGRPGPPKHASFAWPTFYGRHRPVCRSRQRPITDSYLDNSSPILFPSSPVPTYNPSPSLRPSPAGAASDIIILVVSKLVVYLSLLSPCITVTRFVLSSNRPKRATERAHWRAKWASSAPRNSSSLCALTSAAWSSSAIPRKASTMGFVQSLTNRIPSSRIPSLEKLPALGNLSQHRERITPRFAFFRRRIRLRGNSKISIPLGVVLLFPCLVIILILVLVVRHPSGPAKLLIPAGAPPSIRYATFDEGSKGSTQLTALPLGASAKSTTRSSRPDALSQRSTVQTPTLRSSFLPETRSSRA